MDTTQWVEIWNRQLGDAWWPSHLRRKRTFMEHLQVCCRCCFREQMATKIFAFHLAFLPISSMSQFRPVECEQIEEVGNMKRFYHSQQKIRYGGQKFFHILRTSHKVTQEPSSRWVNLTKAHLNFHEAIHCRHEAQVSSQQNNIIAVDQAHPTSHFSDYVNFWL